MYQDKNVKEVVFRKGRFYIRLKKGLGQITLPRANFVWLQYNPTFSDIPKGYIVHHLDHDQTNDDPSNLVIMQKYHHVAHHWKQKKIEVPVTVDVSEKYTVLAPDYPLKRPVVIHVKSRNKFSIKYQTLDCKKGQWKLIGSFGGETFRTREAAEAAIDKIWPFGFKAKQ